MLTESTLKANAVLAALTPEQIQAITTLSQNDENAVIASKIAEIAVRIDADVLASTGIEKQQGEKYYDYLKRAGSSLKAKADKAGDQTELEKLKNELAEAKEAMKKNTGDATLKADVDRLAKEVADEKQRVKDLQNQAANKDKEWQAKIDEEKGRLISLRIDNEANAALTGMKFKDEKLIPPDLRQIAIDAAKAKILAENKADWIDDGKGGQRLVFRDKATDQIKNNPENALNPFTFGEMLSKELTAVIDKGHQQTGTGTKPNPTATGVNGTISVAHAKTKVEANEIIDKALLAMGIARSHADYNTKYQEAMKTLPEGTPMQ